MRKKGIKGIRKRIRDIENTAPRQNETQSKGVIMPNEIIQKQLEEYQQNLEKIQSNIFSAKEQAERLQGQIGTWETQKNVLTGAISGLQRVIQDLTAVENAEDEPPVEVPPKTSKIDEEALKEKNRE